MKTNPWRKFSDELPDSHIMLKCRHGEGIIDCLYQYKPKNGGKLITDNPAYFLSFSFKNGDGCDLEWRYDQDDWLFPEEVTGNEDADYWLARNKDGSNGGFYDCLNSALQNFDNQDLLLKPLKEPQPPKWMIGE